jgi:hypothetical protein
MKGELRDRLVWDLAYHAPDNDAVLLHGRLREAAMAFGFVILDACPEGRELSSALTKLEECLFHANAAVARRERP